MKCPPLAEKQRGGGRVVPRGGRGSSATRWSASAILLWLRRFRARERGSGWAPASLPRI